MSDPKRLTDEFCDRLAAQHVRCDPPTLEDLRSLINAALDLGLNRGLQRAAEIARAHPIEKPHHRYSHWVAIHGGELRELIAAAITREREETR